MENELDNFENAEIDLATGNYRTLAQFIEVSDCAFHGVFFRCYEAVSQIWFLHYFIH